MPLYNKYERIVSFELEENRYRKPHLVFESENLVASENPISNFL